MISAGNVLIILDANVILRVVRQSNGGGAHQATHTHITPKCRFIRRSHQLTHTHSMVHEMRETQPCSSLQGFTVTLHVSSLVPKRSSISLGHIAFLVSLRVPGIVGRPLPWPGGASAPALRELSHGLRGPCSCTRSKSRGLPGHGRRTR